MLWAISLSQLQASAGSSNASTATAFHVCRIMEVSDFPLVPANAGTQCLAKELDARDVAIRDS